MATPLLAPKNGIPELVSTEDDFRKAIESLNKALKLFEEIKSDVFRSAARKLRNLQHLKRAEMMDDWAKQREIQEAKDRWEKRIEDYNNRKEK